MRMGRLAMLVSQPKVWQNAAPTGGEDLQVRAYDDWGSCIAVPRNGMRWSHVGLERVGPARYLEA